MMEGIDGAQVTWVVLLVLGIPFCIIALNELVDRFAASEAKLSGVLRFSRDTVLPFLVLVMVLQLVMGLDANNLVINIARTAFWGVFAILIYRATALIVGQGEYKPSDWRNGIPQLFLVLPPYALIGYIAYHVSQNLWALPVREMATTLGIGSIVIAFALQATLSNLVSGLLMIATSPFKIGDWVCVNGVTGQIQEVTWRYTKLIDERGNLVVFPNGAIADGSIENFSRPNAETLIEHEILFSAETPPGDVIRMISETLSKTPGVRKEPVPEVFLLELSNPIMRYGVEFWIGDYDAREKISSDLLSRL